MVIEKTADGLHILDNPVGVLTNSPDFPWHLTNLRNYLNLSPTPVSYTHLDVYKRQPNFSNSAVARL